MSSTSVVFKSRFNELKQIYFDFCHMHTGRSEVETKVVFIYIFVIMEHGVIAYIYIYICDYGTRSYRLTDYCILLLQK